MKIVFGILFIFLGIVDIIWPEIIWRIRHYFTVEGGEPSALYLIFARIIGVILVVVGILFLVGVLG